MSTAALSERIASILAFLSLLSGPALSCADPSLEKDIDLLLDFAENPTRGKIDRVKSLIRVYAILFAWGRVTRDPVKDNEIAELLEYLDSLVPHANFMLKRSSFVPDTLGAVSAGKARAIPLFGRRRPESPPAGSGILLCYQSIEAGEIGIIDFIRQDAAPAAAYAGLGTLIRTDAPRLCARIGKLGHDPETTLAEPFPAGNYACFANSRYEIFVADAPIVIRQSASSRHAVWELFDPQEYRYAYFFPSGAFSPNRFLGDLLTSLYGFSKESADPVIASIIEKLP